MKCGGIGVKRISVSCGKGKMGCMVVKGHGSYFAVNLRCRLG